MDYFAGIDFGGTSVKAGIINRKGKVLSKVKMEIDSQESYANIVLPVVDLLKQIINKNNISSKLKAIGIGSPGFIDNNMGTIVDGSLNIPAFRGKCIVKPFEKEFSVPSFADNDASCATAAELYFGAGRNFSHFSLITLGTGIGGGLVLNGSIYRGHEGYAAEIGHVCVDSEGIWCNCGSRGCFEQYVSGPAISRQYKEKKRKRSLDVPNNLTVEDIFKGACDRDPIAVEVVDEMSAKIAQVFGSLINVLNLEACIIGGGISKAGDILIESISRKLPDFAWPILCKNVTVLAAELHNDAGMIGAAAQAMTRCER